MIHIDIINACTVLTNEEINAAMPALQKQINLHFYPEWGVKANLSFVAKERKPNKDHWWIAIMNNSDEAGALGYHDLTNTGLPIGKVFAATDMRYDLAWTVTLSHEILEMLVDPYINLSAQVDDDTFYAYEVCDPPEDDRFAYKIDDVLVSDFVFPEWFENMKHPVGTKYDYVGAIRSPLEIPSGGYMSILDIHSTRGWVQIFDKSVSKKRMYSARPKVGSRRERRNMSKVNFIKSVVEIEE